MRFIISKSKSRSGITLELHPVQCCIVSISPLIRLHLCSESSDNFSFRACSPGPVSIEMIFNNCFTSPVSQFHLKYILYCIYYADVEIFLATYIVIIAAIMCANRCIDLPMRVCESESMCCRVIAATTWTLGSDGNRNNWIIWLFGMSTADPDIICIIYCKCPWCPISLQSLGRF